MPKTSRQPSPLALEGNRGHLIGNLNRKPMTDFPRRALPCLTLLLVLGAACGGDGGPTVPVVRTPTSITMAGGNNQSGIVGSTLPQPISVVVSDARGPIPDVAVTFTTIDGGGAAVPPTRRTDQSGVAATGWRVGTQAGQPNQIRASVEGLVTTVSFSADAISGPAALVSPIGGVGQLAVVNSAVVEPPRVLVGDSFGNPVPGISVTFSVTAGNGVISGATAVSNAAGVAQVGSWTMGPVPGANTLRATLASGGFADILATGTAAALQLQAGNSQTGNTGTQLAGSPTVRAVDGAMAPLAGVPVTFAVSDGGGSVVGAVAITNASGLASPAGWILGSSVGINQLTATAVGVAPVTFTAMAVPGVPATVADETVGPLGAFLGNFLTNRPRIQVRDAQGAPVAGVPVVFDVVSGGGQVFGGATVTDPTGRAEVIAWRLGQGGATQTLRTTIPNLAPILINATASPAPAQGDFTIELRYVGQEPSPAVRAAFDAAVEKWQRVIVGDLPEEVGPIPASGTLCNAVNENVDDVVIFVRLETIDGPGGVLGSAGPCWIRDDSDLTIVGGMRFDVADMASLENSGQLQLVMLHEMGHVLGIGTLWRIRGLLIGFQTVDPHFQGPAARTVFPSLFSGGTGYTGNHVPVENTGGPGTRDGHWRESILRNELMTGFLNAGSNPLSALSLVSLRDLGYLVDDAVSDFYEIAPLLMGAPSATGPGITMPPVSQEPIRRRIRPE